MMGQVSTMAAEQGGPSKLESPERSHPISAKETQDSPLFTYLCSLSPIKPVRSVHVAQTFSELSFPPPPAVFVSPRVDQKATTCLKRAVSRARGVFMRPVAGHGKENLCSRKQNSVGGPSLSKGEAIPPKEVKEESSNSSPSNSPTKLGNNFVEQYLADPIETGLPRPSSDLVHFETFLEKSISENVEEHESLTPLPSEVTDDRVDSDSRSTKPAECQISVNVDAQEVSKGTIEIAGRKMVEVFVIPKDANAEELTPKENGSVEQLLDIDQNSSDLAFLLSGTTDKLSGQIDWPKQQPHQPVSGFLASTTEFFTENIEGTETDLNLQEMSGDYKSELVIEVKEEDEMEVSKDDQVAVSFRDGMVVVVFHEVAQRAKVRERGERNGDRKIDLPEQVSNANANHRGVLRRCLNFESTEAHRKSLSITATTSQGSLSDSEAHSLSPISTSNLTISESQLSLVKAEQKTPPSDIIACSKAPMPSMMSASRRSSIVSQNTVESLARCDSHLVSSARNSSASLLSMGMPSGIGLHLNSLAGALSHSTRENSSTCTSHSSAINMKERTPESASGNSGGTLQAGSSVVVSLVEKTRMDHLESSAGSAQTGVTKSTTRFRSLTLGIKQLDGNTRFCGVEKRLSPLGRKRVLLQDFCRQSDLDMSDDSGQSPQSSKNKRKLSLGGEKNTDGCKRCNCKKSKCLKLYCECFAAGVYCVDSCSCHNCFNKPEFEDTVLETRKQIESRNPLAFAPKIVKGADSVAIIGDEVGDTSASARHKRGCNCKKSMCLKKYCECYQAGVGCSDFCRCEGCKNLYGRKGSEELDDKVSQEGLSEKQFAEDEPSRPDLKAVVATSDQHQNKDLSPITPFQETGRPPVKLRPIGKKRFFSSDALQPSTACCESVVKQARSPSRLLRSSKEEEADLFQISSSKGASSPALTPTPKLSRIGKFSPQWDGLADICTLTPLPHAPNRPTPASASIHDQVDSSSSPSSFRTPLESKELFASMRSTPCGVQSKLDSDSCRLVGLIEDDEDGDDDDTPEFLKESDDALKQSPMSILKPSSSKQKRVSPPHHHPTLLNNTGTRETTTSPAAGKSRKFILHAVSSFP